MSPNTQKWYHPRAPRRRVLLALGWYEYEINLGVAEFARKANWILNDTSGHAGLEHTEWKGDGIITLLSTTSSPSILKLIQGSVIPVVDLDNEHTEISLPRVVHDNPAIGRMAAEHLIGQGFKHFLYYQVYDSWVERERLQGFQDAVQAAGKTLHLVTIPPDRREPGMRVRYLAKQLRDMPLPLAAMGQYDGSATEIVHACERAELLVPEQVAVVGADNDPISSELGPVPLTSVDTDRRRLGYEGAALLERLMDGETAPTELIRVPPQDLVVRRSSDVLAVESLPLAQALRMIKDHYHNPALRVDDIADMAGVSRRTLYTLFEKNLDRTVNDEIRRVRIHHAKEMLYETTEKTNTIAMDVGFNSRENFNRAFRAETGLPPSRFRNKKSKAGSESDEQE